MIIGQTAGEIKFVAGLICSAIGSSAYSFNYYFCFVFFTTFWCVLIAVLQSYERQCVYFMRLIPIRFVKRNEGKRTEMPSSYLAHLNIRQEPFCM